MYRLFLFFFQLLLLLIILSFILSNPFIISFDIGDLKYSFSSNLFAIILITITFFFYLIMFLYFKSRFSLRNYILQNKYKKIEKGYIHFIDGMIAIANKDNKNAVKSHKKMNNYLKDDPALSLLLRSEVYKIERKTNELSDVYELMLKSKKTEALGLRGLMEQNLNIQDYHHAFLYGERLFNLNPHIDKLYETLIYIAAKTRNWNQLILISDKAYTYNIIDKNICNENKSIGYYEIAKVQSDVNIKNSIKNINKAIELKKYFPPFIKLHLNVISKTQNLSLLKKLIKKYWQMNTSSVVRSIITSIIVENKLDKLEFINQIIKNNNNNEESKKLLIFFAIRDQNWKIARDNILGLIGANPSREICLFMSEIELGENDDKQKSDSWILRSENSISENLWVCKITKQSQEDWNSISNSGYFNSLVIKHFYNCS